MKELNPQLQSTHQKRVAAMLTISQLGYAHWLFGNVYEAVVRVPERLANDYEPGKDDRRLPSVLSSGSPVCYYLPGVPVVIGATLSAVLAGWRRRNDRPWLASLAASALFGVIATAWLVRTVNLKLFVAGHPLTAADRDRLLRIWYRVNILRLLAASSAWLIAGGSPRASAHRQEWKIIRIENKEYSEEYLSAFCSADNGSSVQESLRSNFPFASERS
jgi:hypothetical protein